ncbi:19802_t:CDS:2, partial [Gigaspora rosea]
FLLFADASGIAIGAILSQKNNQGRERKVTYFRQYLYGTRFTLIIDHSALKFLINQNFLENM